MSDIFISYARDDRPRAERLAHALESEGWSVWWDPQIPAGRTFDEVIEEALDAARCVVVLWSQTSVTSDWVREEATEGKNRGILVPVLIDEVRIPLGFRRIHAADLIDWEGSTGAPTYAKLVDDIAEILGPPPRAAETRAPPREQAPERKAEPAGAPAGEPRGATQEPKPPPPPPPRFTKWFAVAGLGVLLLVGLYALLRPTPTPKPVPKPPLAQQPPTETEEDRRRAEEEARRKAAGEAQRRKQEDIARLLTQAEEAFHASRLTTPADDNAVKYYREVLELDRANAAAREGLRQVVVRYVELAESKARQGDLKGASAYLDTAEGLAPGDPIIQRAREHVGKLAQPLPQPPVLTAGTVFRDPLRDGGEAPEMVVVRPGSVTMGSPDNEDGRQTDEGPLQTVTLRSTFAIGRYEVTVGAFRQFVNASSYRTEAESAGGCWTWVGSEWKEDSGANWRGPGFSQSDDHPVVCVSWNDANRYVDWLTEQTGKRYRLPTEAEWEYAGRAGTVTARFWGNDPHQACDYANVRDQTAKGQFPGWTDVHNCRDGYVYTAPAGRYAPNRYGLHDILGNVWEWVEDCYHDSYRGLPLDGRPWITGECGLRVVRGGSWGDFPRYVRSADRYGKTADGGNSNMGFRLAQDLE